MKVLVISHNSFSPVSNNGKTLEAIFQNYRKEDIAQLFFSNTYVDLNYCFNYFRITDADILRNNLFFNTKNFTESFAPELVKSRTKNHKRQNSLVSYVKNAPFLRDLLWKTGKWKISRLFEWIEEFNPDYVFYVAGPYSFSHCIAKYIANKYQIKLVTYFTDDYLLYPIIRDWKDAFQKWRMRNFYKDTISKSSLCFVIGDKMAREYEKYFNKCFYPIMNMGYNCPKLPSVNNKEIIISYFGGLHLDRWKQIIRLGKNIRNINEINIKKGLSCSRILVYSHSCSDEIMNAFNECGIEYKGFVDSANLRIELSKADILLHVESDDIYYRSLTRLSVSTKIPEYFSTGKCVLGFGPLDVASMELLNDNELGYVISSDANEFEIMKSLNELLTNQNKRDEIATKAYNYSAEQFDPSRIRNEFENRINSMF